MTTSHATRQALVAPESLAARYAAVRNATSDLAAPLSAEDAGAQSMPDASPAKWHLAHTSWFFETFVLAAHREGYERFDPGYEYLFNSYYNGVGSQYPRAQRGLLTRPALDTVRAYRRHVDDALIDALLDDALPAEARALIELGLHHEQQHQELLLTDIKHLFSQNPLRPAYQPRALPPASAVVLQWREYPGGIVGVGGDQGFCFDNELPRHAVLLRPFLLASRPVTNAEFRAFVEDGGYRDARHWLSEGWATLQALQWQRPLYWSADLDTEFTLHGEQPIAPDRPACHLSYFEADAYARWAGARLPTEFEWEAAAAGAPVQGQFVDSAAAELHPRLAEHAPDSMFGAVWSWTCSPYVAYPGYRPAAGAVGEYNGKFMCNQWVLRGGSCVSPRSHLRSSYRNFFPADARWQFSGLRLAKELN